MAEGTTVEEKRPDRPDAPGITPVAASRDVKGSKWGGGGFVDYGGQGAQALNTQLNYNKEVSDYEKEVKRLEVKEADAVWGELTPEDSGNEGYDSTVENIARNSKTKYAQAKKDYEAGNIDSQEYSQQKNDLFKGIDDLQKAGQNLVTMTGDYSTAKDEDRISASTPAHIRDAFEELQSGGKNISYVEGEDGKVYLEGTTASGEMPIKIPVSGLAEGNGIRFNEKFDTAGTVDGIATGIHKITQNGANLDYEQLKGRIDNDLNNYIGGESARRAIAADEMGMMTEEYDRLNEEDPDALKQQIKDFVSDKVEAQYFPNARAERDALKEAKIATEHAKASKIRRGGRKEDQKEADAINEAKYVLNRSDFSADPNWLSTNLGAQVIPETTTNDDGDEVPTGKSIINVDGKSVIVDPYDPRKAKEVIAREFFGVRAQKLPWLTGSEQGGARTHIRTEDAVDEKGNVVRAKSTTTTNKGGQNAPVQRNTPFKRVRNFLGI